MDLFDELDLLDSPATDTTTGQRIPRGTRCPDCALTAYGPCGALNATTVRTDDGYVITSHCNCGRLIWYDDDKRQGWDEPVPPYPDGTPGHGSPYIPYTPTPPARSVTRTVWRQPPHSGKESVGEAGTNPELHRPSAAGRRNSPPTM